MRFSPIDETVYPCLYPEWTIWGLALNSSRFIIFLLYIILRKTKRTHIHTYIHPHWRCKMKKDTWPWIYNGKKGVLSKHPNLNLKVWYSFFSPNWYGLIWIRIQCGLIWIWIRTVISNIPVFTVLGLFYFLVLSSLCLSPSCLSVSRSHLSRWGQQLFLK